MQFQGRALYNLVRLHHIEDPSTSPPVWQVTLYREMEIEELFALLQKIGIKMTADTFLTYANSCDSPEELADCLTLEEASDNEFEKAYLCLFELWRRLLPQKQTLSIFGDELDHLIFLYDRGDLVNDDHLQKVLSELEDILDDTADKGLEPVEALHMVSQYLAHDIETFLFEYITKQMDEGSETYASELIDGFYPYVQAKLWFDFLKARLFAVRESEEADSLFLGLLELLEEEPDLELSFEIASFVVNRGDTHVFIVAAKNILAEIQHEEDFQALLSLIAEFYRCLDDELAEMAITDLLSHRKEFEQKASVMIADKKRILELLKDPERDKI